LNALPRVELYVNPDPKVMLRVALQEAAKGAGLKFGVEGGDVHLEA